MKENIKPATGRLGVLVVGVGGAVATHDYRYISCSQGLGKSYRLNHTNGCYAHAGWQRETYQRHSAFG